MLYPFSRLFSPARLRPLCAAAARKKKGFNLIEAAIVLGVVGLVIGGIWIAAAAVMEEWKVRKTVTDVETIARNIKNLISVTDRNAIIAANGGASLNIAPTLYNSGIFPTDWISGGTVKNPFGGNVSVVLLSGSARYEIWLYNVPQSTCPKLVVALSVAGSNEDDLKRTVYDLVVYPSNTVFSTLPISLSAAIAACSASTNTVIPNYYLLRIN